MAALVRRIACKQILLSKVGNNNAAQFFMCRMQMAKRRYDAKVIDHFINLRNVGTLDKTHKDVGTGLVGAPSCGDVMQLQIKTDENGIIIEAVYKTFGCASAIASSSYVVEKLKGMTLEQALQLTNKDIAKELNLPPVKLHCSILAEDGIKAAIKDLEAKRMQQQQSQSAV